MARLPQVSGKGLIKFLEMFGYRVIRRKGAHVALQRLSMSGKHAITLRDDPIVAGGCLNDILDSVSARVEMRHDRLIAQLKDTIRTDDGTRIQRTQLTEAEEVYAKKLEAMGLRLSHFVRYADGSLSFGGTKTVADTSDSKGRPNNGSFNG